MRMILKCTIKKQGMEYVNWSASTPGWTEWGFCGDMVKC
jgi:hypothetical protein